MQSYVVIKTTDIMNYRTWKAEKALQDHLEKQNCMHTHTHSEVRRISGSHSSTSKVRARTLNPPKP